MRLSSLRPGEESHTVLRLASGLSVGNQKAGSSEHQLFLAEGLIHHQKKKKKKKKRERKKERKQRRETGSLILDAG